MIEYESNTSEIRKMEIFSLLSFVFTGLLLSVNYYYDIGINALFLFPILFVLLPVFLVFYYNKSENKSVVWILVLVSIGILTVSIVDGLLNHGSNLFTYFVMNPFNAMHGFNTSLIVIDVIQDGSGFLSFIGSIFIIYYLNKFMGSIKNDED